MIVIKPLSRGMNFRGGDNLGFPILLVADLVITAAYQGWSYYRTKQQIQQAKSISATEMATPKDIETAARRVEEKLGIRVPPSELRELIKGLVQERDAPAGQQIPPSQLLAVGGQLSQPGGGMPTWGWALFGLVGFMLLQQRGGGRGGGLLP